MSALYKGFSSVQWRSVQSDTAGNNHLLYVPLFGFNLNDYQNHVIFTLASIPSTSAVFIGVDYTVNFSLPLSKSSLVLIIQ